MIYDTNLSVTGELFKAGARVCKAGSLMFLLLRLQRYQWYPVRVKRICYVNITVVPNNETRCLNLFYNKL